MRYIFWVAGVTAAAALQAVLNNCMPVYLAPNLFMMFTVYMTFYYGYYTAVAGIVFVSYISSVFSHGGFLFYVFSYVSVFYSLNFLKKFFDRKQFVAIVAISVLTTLSYPIFVLLPSVLSGKAMLFKEAFNLGILQMPVNILAAHLMFRYLPYMDFGSGTDRELILGMRRSRKV